MFRIYRKKKMMASLYLPPHSVFTVGRITWIHLNRIKSFVCLLLCLKFYVYTWKLISEFNMKTAIECLILGILHSFQAMIYCWLHVSCMRFAIVCESKYLKQLIQIKWFVLSPVHVRVTFICIYLCLHYYYLNKFLYAIHHFPPWLLFCVFCHFKCSKFWQLQQHVCFSLPESQDHVIKWPHTK